MKSHLLAQSLTVGGNTVQGPLDPSLNNIGDVINRVTNAFLIPLASVILLVVIIWGGYDLMTSQGSPDKIKSAQGKIMAGFIGFGLLVLSFLIVKLVSYVFGLGEGII